MLKVKGTGIISQIAFVRERFGEAGFDKWRDALSEPARVLVTSAVFASSWYEGEHAVLEPRDKICEVFFNSDPKGAREIGRFTADRSLNGIYRVFVRVGSPEWTVGKVAGIFGTFFTPGELAPVFSQKGKLVMRLSGFPARSEAFEEMICGFAERALELCGCKEVKVERTASLARWDPHADFSGTWLI
jgi:hypothetical protein